MSRVARVTGFAVFVMLVVVLWYLSAFWPWRAICGDEGPLGFSWLTSAVEPLCSRDGIAGIEALDRRGGIVQRQLQAIGLGEFGIVVWALLVFLILSLTQAVWSRVARLVGGKE